MANDYTKDPDFQRSLETAKRVAARMNRRTDAALQAARAALPLPQPAMSGHEKAALLLRYVHTPSSVAHLDFSEASLDEANLNGAGLRGVILQRVRFFKATLLEADFEGADLRGAVFARADMRWANLRGCNLAGANLIGANLSGACLLNVDLGSARIANSLPVGFDSGVVIDDVTYSRSEWAPVTLAQHWQRGAQVLNLDRFPLDAQVAILPRGNPTDLPHVVRRMQERLAELERFLVGASGKGKVFLSYSSPDRATVECVRDELRARGVPTWYDQEELDIGDPILHAVDKAIDESVFVAVFLSNASVRSKWVEQELRIAFEKTTDGAVKFLPVLLDNVELPGYLKGLRYADLRDRSDERVKATVEELVRAIARFNLRIDGSSQ